MFCFHHKDVILNTSLKVHLALYLPDEHVCHYTKYDWYIVFSCVLSTSNIIVPNLYLTNPAEIDSKVLLL
jgi:hypothetical protein